MTKIKGKCEVCGKEPRLLTELNSGQKICRTCLREIRPQRPKHLATFKQIDDLRELGIDVSDDATKEDVKRLKQEWKKRQPDSFYTKLSGVTFENEDGESRQNLIRNCRQGDELLLIREPDNKFDSNAIAVYTSGGFLKKRKAIGWLSADLAERYSVYLDKGGIMKAKISAITGGQRIGFLKGRQPYGVNVQITYWPGSIDW